MTVSRQAAGARARLRRIDLRVAGGVALMLAAIVGGTSVIRAAQARTPVLVAARAIQPGQAIVAEDLRTVEVTLAPGVSFLGAGERDGIVGRIAAAALAPGQLLVAGALAKAPPLPSGTVAMSLLLGADAAVGGILRAGDRVAVIALPANERPSSILAVGVAVLQVTRAEDAGQTGSLVTLILRLEQAQALAAAKVGGVALALMAVGP